MIKTISQKIRAALTGEGNIVKKFKAETAHYFFNLLCIAEGYHKSAIKDERDAEHREKLKVILNAVERVENVVKNVVTKGEIHE